MPYLLLELAPRRRLAGGERGSRVSQFVLNVYCERVRAAEHASGDRFRLLERRHGLAEVVERGAGVKVERPRVIEDAPNPKAARICKPSFFV